MSLLSQFFGTKPIRVVEYTSGSGTFTPLVSNSWCRITLVGGGAGGNRVVNGVSGSGGLSNRCGQAPLGYWTAISFSRPNRAAS